MCFTERNQKFAAPIIPSATNTQANQAARTEDLVRQARGGASNFIFTSPIGIPAKTDLGAA